MEVVNKLIPNDEQLQGFLDPDATGPICMVNLLKFRERAGMRMAGRPPCPVLRPMRCIPRAWSTA